MDFDYRVYADLTAGMPDAEGLREVLGDGTSGLPDAVFGDGLADAYLILGTASSRYGEIAEGYPEGWADDLVDDLVGERGTDDAGGGWRVDFRSGDTVVLKRPAVEVAP